MQLTCIDLYPAWNFTELISSNSAFVYLYMLSVIFSMQDPVIYK